MHHHQTIAVAQRVAHIVRDHERSELLRGHQAIGEFEHLSGRLGIQGCGVFIKQQQLGTHKRGHQKRERLTLAARKKAHVRSHALFQTEVKFLEHLAELFGLLGLGTPAQTELLPSARSHGEVLLDHHVAGRAAHRILKDAADVLCALVFGHVRNIDAAHFDRTGVNRKDAGNRVQKRRLTCAVGTNHGCEVAVFERQVHAAQCALFIDAARKKGLFYALSLKHLFLRIASNQRALLRARHFSRISGIESAIATRMAVKSLRSLGGIPSCSTIAITRR